MTEPLSAAEKVGRLQASLHSSDTLRCTEAEELLSMLLEVESAGEDVEQNPDFRAVLNHLDHCTACLDLYEEMINAREAVLEAEAVLPDYIPDSVPTFFSKPIPKGDYVLLQVLKGLPRRFALRFDMPRLAPALPTMSGQQQILYSDTLQEVQWSPLLVLSVGQNDEDHWLQIALRDISKDTRWQLTLELGNQVLKDLTDSQGIARFDIPKAAEMSTLRLICEEQPQP